MKADLEDFETGWYGLTLGLKESEIDELVKTLTQLKEYKTHFHLRSAFEGEGGIGDIEIYYQDDSASNNLTLEPSRKPEK